MSRAGRRRGQAPVAARPPRELAPARSVPCRSARARGAGAARRAGRRRARPRAAARPLGGPSRPTRRATAPVGLRGASRPASTSRPVSAAVTAARRFGVGELADQQHVGVLARGGPQRGRVDGRPARPRAGPPRCADPSARSRPDSMVTTRGGWLRGRDREQGGERLVFPPPGRRRPARGRPRARPVARVRGQAQPASGGACAEPGSWDACPAVLPDRERAGDARRGRERDGDVARAARGCRAADR